MNVIVLGYNHYNTLGLIRSLGEAGHTVYLILYNHGDNYVSKSRYITKTYLLSNQDQTIEMLKSVVASLNGKPVVLATSDMDAELLNNHYKELRELCFIEGDNLDGSINRYRDKDVGEKLAIECGFITPPTIVVQDVEAVKDIKLRPPYMVKGNNSIRGGKSASKKCSSYEELLSFVSEIHADFFPLQIQKFIEKEYEILFLGCSLYGGREVFCPVANRKFRHYPKDIGLGSYSKSVNVAADKILHYLSQKISLYIKTIGYTGLFSAELLYSGGTFYFLEVNLRNDGTSYLATASGINLPDLLCRSYTEGNVSLPYYKFKEIYFMHAIADIRHVIHGQVGIIEWLMAYLNSVKTIYNSHDIHPHVTFIGERIKYILFGTLQIIKNRILKYHR